ncbi:MULTISPECIES: hypothetical protein [Streptomyces]|uniref:Uncharacterized protein n=1 Tax=Streptomyces cadmiisoli TaxID=2184053 RepID=A0A2Z4JEE1_9ACTN|nr:MULTISPECIES: hypothetical protein [Streptomyces]AWW43290.1 hypothetical protein DN051_42705 [Streptomyces cadmiisoli]
MPSQSAASLRSRYVEQAASDLEENRRLQEELAEKIRMLQQEEALLVDILTLAQRYVGSSDAPLPEQAHEEPDLTGKLATSETTSSTAAPASRRSAHAKAGARSARHPVEEGAKGKSRLPLLGDLLAELLSAYDEPRHAKELRDELLEKHPGRTPTPQVVRNTLESLVAKGRIRRHKQDRSVMYTLVERAPRGTVAAPDDDI